MDIVVYGADWCEDTEASRHKLDQLDLPYEYVNIDLRPEAAEFVRQVNHGRQRTPTIVLGDGSEPLVEPSDEQLEARLKAAGYL